MLLGPTGNGKTKTVEALADVLHGSEKNVLKIDCGEFQMEHEVAKLIGAPPGYLGHRETQPMLTQQKLNGVTTEKCNLSLVLFDEIEKAAPSMTRLLLGVLDKGILRLGDNTIVNFEKSLVFLTSNLGAREMMREINPDFGFQSVKSPERADLTGKLQNIALVSVRKRFSPEFVNRIDCIITYQPLTPESLSTILDQQIADLQNHVNTRLGARSFTLEVPFESRRFLLLKGRRARIEPHHPPPLDPTPGHPGRNVPSESRRARARGSGGRWREPAHSLARGRRCTHSAAPHRAAGRR
jgi:ATP-dependent Clp protease ATP-binding subunit ClpA